MSDPASRLSSIAMVMAAGCLLSACAGTSFSNFGGFTSDTPPAAPAGPAVRPSVAPEDIVGRWGLGAFHKPEDQARTEVQARSQCKQPYVINRSSVGVAMLGHDNPAVQDMVIKGGQDGKTYVGPGAEAGDADDREVVSYDGRVLVLRWIDPEVAGRYGTMVLVRCGPEGTAPRAARTTAKPKPR